MSLTRSSIGLRSDSTVWSTDFSRLVSHLSSKTRLKSVLQTPNSKLTIIFNLRHTAKRVASPWFPANLKVKVLLIMLQSFIIILREGFESFLLVAVILSYLRKSARRKLAPAVYWAIAVALVISGALGYLLFQMQTGNDLIDRYFGHAASA